MATLMTFIDPFQTSAIYNWWDRAGDDDNFSASQVRAWRSLYLIRRDKSELAVKLPPKIILKHPVAARANELEIYSYYEATFFKGLKGQSVSILAVVHFGITYFVYFFLFTHIN